MAKPPLIPRFLIPIARKVKESSMTSGGQKKCPKKGWGGNGDSIVIDEI